MAPLDAVPAGSVIFRNYQVYYDGTTWQPTNGQPVFVSDCLTPASGSNYVVELLAPDGERLATTNLRDGPYAGLFGGIWDYVSSERLPPCFIPLLTIRIWDRSTGTNFDSATLKGALSFNNFILGGCGAGVPSGPEELTGFRSFALGNPQCFTNQISFYAPENDASLFQRFSPYFTAPKSAPQAVITLQRAGHLDRTDVVDWSVVAGCTNSLLDCSPTNGQVTFSTGQTSSQFVISVSPQAVEHTVVSLTVKISSSHTNITIPANNGDVLFYDDSYLRVQWSGVSNAPVGYARFDVIGFSPTGLGFYRLQHTANLSPANWLDVTNVLSAMFSGHNLEFDWEFAVPTNQIAPGFYRGVKP